MRHSDFQAMFRNRRYEANNFTLQGMTFNVAISRFCDESRDCDTERLAKRFSL